MAEQRSTPEEKLLKLIEKEDGSETVRHRRRRNLFFGFNSLLFFLKRAAGNAVEALKKGVKEPNLKVLNKLLLVLSILLLGVSVTDFVFNRPDIERVYKKSRHIKHEEYEQEDISQRRPFLHYLEMVQRRNIFSPITLKREKKPEIKQEQLQDMVSDYGLVGISFDDEPMAMIEDKTDNRTYFLHKGDSIGKFEIEDIQENKVILGFDGKKIELI